MSTGKIEASDKFRFGLLCFVAFFLIGFIHMFASGNPDELFTHINEQGETCVSDFLHYYQAGALTLSDQRHLIYDPQVQLDSMNKIIAPRHITRCFYMQYPPFSFALLAPLALFSKEQAYYLWTSLTLAFAAACLAVLNRVRPSTVRLDNIDLGIVILSFVCSAAGVVTFALGQSSWLLVGLYSLYFWGLRRNRPYLAGAALSFSTFKPQYTILLLLPMLTKKRWKALIGMVFVELLQLTLAGFIVGWENVIGYPATLMHAESDPNAMAGGYYAGAMVSLRNILSIFHNQKLTLIVNVVALLTVAPIVWLIWKKVWEAEEIDDQAFNWAAAATVTLTLFLSPHTHIYELVVLVIPAVLTLLPLRKLFNHDGGNITDRIWYFILVTFPVTSWILLASPLSFNFKGLAFLLLLCSIFCLTGLKSRIGKIASLIR